MWSNNNWLLTGGDRNIIFDFSISWESSQLNHQPDDMIVIVKVNIIIWLLID